MAWHLFSPFLSVNKGPSISRCAAILDNRPHSFAMAARRWYNPPDVAHRRTMPSSSDGIAQRWARTCRSWRGVVSGLSFYIQIIQIIVSIALVVVILVQAKGQGGLGGIFGGEGSVFRTRRGVEKTLFNVTVGLATAFFFVSIASVIVF